MFVKNSLHGFVPPASVGVHSLVEINYYDLGILQGGVQYSHMVPTGCTEVSVLIQLVFSILQTIIHSIYKLMINEGKGKITYLPTYLSICGSTALRYTLTAFSVS
jgi:hypothetical protein